MICDTVLASHIDHAYSEMDKLSRKHITKASSEELSRSVTSFERWRDSVHKQSLTGSYGDDIWRALYVQRLFKPRIRTALVAFEVVFSFLPYNFPIFDFMRSLKCVVSIGCGPGSDIAAVNMVLRILFNLQQEVRIIGFDERAEWSEYVLHLNQINYGLNVNNIKFRTLRVVDTTLCQVMGGDICVMSYTDANVQSQKFWRDLKQKFRLIIILDQRNQRLADVLSREQYLMVDYFYKGVKRLFYWFQPIVIFPLCPAVNPMPASELRYPVNHSIPLPPFLPSGNQAPSLWPQYHHHHHHHHHCNNSVSNPRNQQLSPLHQPHGRINVNHPGPIDPSLVAFLLWYFSHLQL